VLPVEPKAFRVLLMLLRNPQKLISKEELLNAVWGDAAVTENSLTRSIALLRRLLGDDTRNPRYIETVATITLRYRNLELRQMVQMKNRVSGLLMESGVSYDKQRLHKVAFTSTPATKACRRGPRRKKPLGFRVSVKRRIENAVFGCYSGHSLRRTPFFRGFHKA